jgi:hypothetical protein
MEAPPLNNEVTKQITIKTNKHIDKVSEEVSEPSNRSCVLESKLEERTEQISPASGLTFLSQLTIFDL